MDSPASVVRNVATSPGLFPAAVMLAFGVVAAGDTTAEVAAPPRRPVMRQLPAALAGGPPSPRELVDARAEMMRRYREPIGRASSAAGATAAAESLLDAAAAEPDRAVKWLLLEEARDLAAAAGNAVVVARAVLQASATYEFDAVTEEYRALAAIPLRALDPARAAGLAEVSERLCQRADAESRRALAADAQALAVRAWQRAGLIDAARRAEARLVELEPGGLRRTAER